jgi:hypothetical protein
MVKHLAPSFLRAGYYRARQWRLDIETWDALLQRDELRGATLAIVGNAGYLGDLDQGEHIDSHRLVLRMNNFRTRGFERQVGARTDIFFTNFYHDVDVTNPEVRPARFVVASVPNNFARGPGRELIHRHGEHITVGLAKMDRRQVYAPGGEFLLAQRRRIGKYPTTGAMAIFLATEFLLRVCGAVYITGFSFFRGRSHYMSERQVVPINHDVAREELLVAERLLPHVRAGRVTLDPTMSAILKF